MKIALVQDGLMCYAGGEQVARCFHLAFPEAPIYTLCYQPHLTFPEFQDCEVRPSWLQHIAKTDDRMKRLFFPLGIMAMKMQDLREFDVVLMSGTHCAKYVRLSKKALAISYSFTPFRLAWDPTSYADYNRSKGVKRMVYDLTIKIMRAIDYRAGQRPNHYVAMTDETSERLRKAYEISDPIEIIPPPVNTHNFKVVDGEKPYYLIVSRLEYYKKVDLVVEAFRNLDAKLIVVGKGTREQEIKALATSDNIEFRSGLSASELGDLYSNCRAFIFPQHEDFGITPLEANAAGRPVIAYAAGGVLTTQIPVATDPSRSTAIYFREQTVESLRDAIARFEEIEDQFDPSFIRSHAETFAEEKFIERIRKFVHQKAARVAV